MARGVALDELPASVLYDVFQDAAAVLAGLYLERERGATDPSVAESGRRRRCASRCEPWTRTIVRAWLSM
jgi:hypothetical protein